MRRAKLVLGVAAIMMALLVAYSAPAMAKGSNNNDTKLDRKDIKLDKQILRENNNDCCFDNHDLFFDDDIFDDHDHFFDNDVIFVNDNDLADELCSPLNPVEVNNLVPGCIFGNNDNVVFDNNLLFVDDFDRHDLFDDDHHHDLFDD